MLLNGRGKSMSDELSFEIEIPTDNDGFVLLQCPLCGEFFKLAPADIKADDVLEIWCPNCGLKSENYITDEIRDLALRMAKNHVQDMIHRQMKELERKTRGGLISFKAGHTPTAEYEPPVIPGIDELEVQNYPCCKRQAKISPSVKLTGGYCPFCGVSYDEHK